MVKISAGLLLFRRSSNRLEVLLVHPGGPYWAHKDDGTWSIPKGLANDGETLLQAAQREFTEETGNPVPKGPAITLDSASYGSKKLFVWAIEADLDASLMKSKLISLEWPPRSGQVIEVPECDKAGWFDLASAKTKLVKGQVVFVERLREYL